MTVFLFDLGGVCLSNHFGFSEQKKLITQFKLNSRNAESFFTSKLPSLNRGKLTEREFLARLFESLGASHQVEEAVQFLRSFDIANEEVLKLVRALQKFGTTAAFTNEALDASDYRVQHFKLDSYFQHIFVSSRIGAAKPDILAYKIVLEMLAVPPSEIVYVDNHERNLDAARALGIQTILFTSAAQLKTELLRWASIT
ncbi:MAG: HAD-IA family hydrolase [Candidatus Woesearchaeota archaeon]